MDGSQELVQLNILWMIPMIHTVKNIWQSHDQSTIVGVASDVLWSNEYMYFW